MIKARRTFTAEQLGAMDLNGDGAVNVADLMVLSNPVVKADFHDGSSVVVEGSVGAGPTVDFSGPFVGRLRYRVRELPNGTPITHMLAVSGTSTVIPIAADDNGVVEDAKTFEVALLESAGDEPVVWVERSETHPQRPGKFETMTGSTASTGSQ